MTKHGTSSRPCVVCICGRPLSGKTSAATVLHEAYGWRVEEADAIGARVLAESRGVAHRRFPYPESARVEWESPECFGAHLGTLVEEASAPIVIAGLRSAAILRWLRAAYPRRVCLVYLAAGVRVCRDRFARTRRQPGDGYRDQLEYAIESDQGTLRRMAQLVIPNHASPQALQDRMLRVIGPDGRGHRTPRERCSACGQVRPVHHRVGAARDPMCHACYEWRFNAEPCSLCRENRPVHLRDAAGAPICKRCYQRTCNVQVCASCGRAKTVCRRNLDGGPLCKDCARHGAALRPSTAAPARKGRTQARAVSR
jgi:hypothetical protein